MQDLGVITGSIDVVDLVISLAFFILFLFIWRKSSFLGYLIAIAFLGYCIFQVIDWEYWRTFTIG